MKVIKTNKLTKYYGKSRGIVDLDLTVEEGECFGFIGPNGAGKSTTIRTLLGLIRPTSGSAEVLGKDIEKDSVSILKDVGYLPSETVFYPGMRVKEILKFSADLRGMDCSAEAAVLCERLQLDPGRKADELSYGNRKKAAIVCALQSDPELLILDEPTGGLDPLMQREFFEIIKERSRRGTTVFLSSHVLHEVQRYCDRAAVIREGKIIACGSVEDLSKTNAKRVTVNGEVDLSGLEGIKDLKTSGGSASFLYGGDMDGLIKRLSEGKIIDLGISEPDLDEIFMHYYEKEGGAE
ncbi:MAG: ABC transporter ATP-binding protein [Clostridia bacterium]|nr:ABC transporter ATP-binding protein [Clostridia bacterium]